MKYDQETLTRWVAERPSVEDIRNLLLMIGRRHGDGLLQMYVPMTSDETIFNIFDTFLHPMLLGLVKKGAKFDGLTVAALLTYPQSKETHDG